MSFTVDTYGHLSGIIPYRHFTPGTGYMFNGDCFSYLENPDDFQDGLAKLFIQKTFISNEFTVKDQGTAFGVAVWYRVPYKKKRKQKIFSAIILVRWVKKHFLLFLPQSITCR
jgi:hypothetical protein